MKNKKIIIITSVVLGILFLTIGVSYSVLRISKTGSNSKLIVGDIYMHYVDSNNSINLENVLPTDTYNTESFFEFTIDGKNTTTNKDIWYEIILKYGDDVENKTRIKDKFLKFTLIETKDGVSNTVFDGKSYNDLNNKRIWVNTINKNTTNDVSITYRLYMYISNDIIIGNVDQDYTIDEWNNIFASIKVDVLGDFNEKNIETDESCFTTYTIDHYQLNTNMTTEELNKCITYFTDWGFNDSETPEAFCQGTGTRYGGSFQNYLDDGYFGSDTFTYLETNNIINLSSKSIEITDYDNTCGSDVVIPSKINGYSVTNIGTSSFNNKNLTSVIIPSSITYISDYAFYKNQLTSIIIPSSVTYIDYQSFSENNITSVNIPESVIEISCGAFDNTVEITKPDSLTCTDISD